MRCWEASCCAVLSCSQARSSLLMRRLRSLQARRAAAACWSVWVCQQLKAAACFSCASRLQWSM